jgi:hypothetical protein
MGDKQRPERKCKMITFDFGDGKGPVPAHKHPNGGGWVADSAWVSGDAWVYGDAWEKSPLYIQGTRHALTNSAKGKITIGCHTKTFSEWLRHGVKIGKAEGYSEAEIKEYIGHIKHIAKFGV